MTFKIVQLDKNHQASRYGFSHAIELRKTDGHLNYSNWQFGLRLKYFCQEKYGRDYRPHYKRPGRNAKWYIQDAHTFYRICFKRESDITFALMSIA